MAAVIRLRSLFQLTHPTRGATRKSPPNLTNASISTHTPHTGCDEEQENTELRIDNFNSHTPHGVRPRIFSKGDRLIWISTHTPHTGCDIAEHWGCAPASVFQLTHPTRGATTLTSALEATGIFQLTHPTRGATRLSNSAVIFGEFQLTHPTRGATGWESDDDGTMTEFQLTHPTRGATPVWKLFRAQQVISTHTPHTGCDNLAERDQAAAKISTHTPHTGCDTWKSGSKGACGDFNSHTPHGVRPLQWWDTFRI